MKTFTRSLILTITMTVLGSATQAAVVRDFELLSINSGATASGNGGSLNPVVSSNGQFVAFASDAGNLVLNDNNSTRDVFWRDRVAGTTRLVSRTLAGASGNADSDAPVISSDGRYVAFHSRASDLVATDSNTHYDVFVWDSNDNSVTLVSRTLAGASGAGDSYSPQLSASGRVVSFASTATDLVPNDTNGTADAFARDLDASTTYLASINTNNVAGNGASGVPVLSANGRYVAFLSRASDLVTNDLNSLNDVFVHDLQTRVTKLVSVDVAGTGAGNRLSLDPVISADGRYIAFSSQATNLVTITDTNDFPDVFVRDMQALSGLGQTKLVSVNGSGTAAGGNAGTLSILPASFTPFLSADGTKVLFASLAQDLVANDANGKQDVFLRDLNNDTTTLVSTNRFGTGSGNAASGLGAYSMSADVRYVAFFSEASNVGTADTNGRTDVFLRDLSTGSTKIISRVNLGGFAANGHSFQPVISADGSTILFTSEAGNLDNRDANAQSDVFAAATTLGPPNFGVVDVGISISSVSARTVGNPFTLTVTVTNHSANLATGLVVGNSSPEFLRYITGTVSQGTLTEDDWVVGDLPANGSATATVSLVATNLGTGNLIVSFDRRDQLDSNLNNNSALTTITASQTAAGALFYLPGNTAYLSRTNSPFFAEILAGTVTLENFESGALSLAGVTASAGSALAPGTLTDSVDADDGVLDGFGTAGHSFFVTGTNAVTFTFNSTVLGRLPTKVGIVLTDGDHEGAGIEAFDAGGASLGVLGPFEIGDRSFFGETAEDRFFGVEFAGGISTLRVFYLKPGFELDHLQLDVAPPPAIDLQLTGIAPTSATVGASFTVTLMVTNLGPTAVTSAMVTNAEPGPIQLGGVVASQGAFDAMTGDWNIGGLAVGAGATLTLTVTATNIGLVQFYSRVSSEVLDPNTANDVVTRTVRVPNQPPVLTYQTNNVVVLEDAGAQSLVGFATFSGPEPGQMVASASLSNDNPALFSVQPAATNGTLIFNPATNANGSATVTVIVQDDGGTANGGVDRTTNTFTITVTAVNDAPVITFASNSVVMVEDAGAQTLAAFATFATVEAGQAITNAVSTNSNPALFAVQPYFTVGGTLRFTPAADVSGSAMVTVVVEDDGGTANGGGNRATNTFTLVVSPVNAAPSFTFTNFPATDGVQEWVRDVTTNSSGVKVITDSQGNVIVAGDEVVPNEVLQYKVIVAKYSASGTALWNTSVTGAGASDSLQVKGLAVDSAGAVIVVVDYAVAAGTHDFLTLKYDADAALVWSNRFDTLSEDTPMAVAVDGNNKVIVTGSSRVGVYTDFLTIKYLSDGTPFWTNRWSYSGPGNDVPRSVTVDSGNDVYVAGDGSNITNTYAVILKLGATDGLTVWTNEFAIAGQNSTGEAVRVGGGDFAILAGSLNDAGGQGYFGVVKYNVSGAVVWTNLYARNAEFLHVHGLAVDSDGNAIVTGNTEVTGNMDFTTIKYLADGTPAWTNHYDGTAAGRDHPNAIAVNAAGEVFVTGDSTGSNLKDYLTVKYTAAGAGVWTNRYNGTLNGDDTPNAIAVDNSTNVFVTGAADGVMRTIKYAFVPSPGANQTALQGVGAITVPSFIATSSAGGANEAAQTLSYLVTADNPGLFSVQPAISAAGVLTYSVNPAASGLAVITVRAQDDGGTANGGVDTSAPQTFNITVLTGAGAVFYVWLGGTGDWNDPAAWTPRGVPGVADTVNIGSGVVQLTNAVTVVHLTLDGGTLGGAGSLTVRSSMNWNAGVMSGAGTTTIPRGATLGINNADEKNLNRRLDNYGTVAWAGARITGDNSPVINNHAGAIFLIQTDATLFESYGGGARTFNNAGLLGKLDATGTSTWQGTFNNSGTIEIRTGTLLPAETINLATSSFIGTGTFLVNGGALTLSGAQTITAGANVEFAGGTLTGTSTIVGTLKWTGGIMGTPGKTTIATNGVLSISGATEKNLNRQLDNYGTVTWTGARITGDNAPVINNFAGALFDIQTDSPLYQSYSGGDRTFNNSGTMRVSTPGAGQVNITGAVNNAGLIYVELGTLALGAGGSSTGTFTNAAGAALEFTGGTHVLGAGAVFTGAGVSRVNGGSVNPGSNVTALVDGTFEVASGSLGGAGDLLVLATRELRWTGGAMSGVGRAVITNGATLNISGPTEKYLNRRLDNHGTVTWTGARITGDSNPVINNFAGALFDIQTDSPLYESFLGGDRTFNNAGTLRKSVATGTSTWQGVLNSSGTINIQTGTLVPAETINLATSGFSGAGTFLVNGGTVTLSGTQTIAAGANVEFAGGTLNGTGTIVGTLKWTGGVMAPGGTTTIAASGALLISGAAEKNLNRQLDNYGTVTWTGARITGDSNPVINNFAGALFDTQTDTTLYESYSGGARTFNNAGTVRKSVATGTSTWLGDFNNSGVLELQRGILSLANNYAPGAGSSLKVFLGGLTAGTQFGQLQVAGTATLTGALNIVLTNSFVPVVPNSFLVVSSGTRVGAFSSVTGDDLGGFLTLVSTYLLGNLTLVATDLSALPPLAPLPPLVPQAVGADRSLRWPGAAEGYELESAPSITGPWTAVLTLVAQDNGDSVVRLPAGGTRFYRLVRPAAPRPGGNPAQ